MDKIKGAAGTVAEDDFVTKLLPASSQVGFGAFTGFTMGYALRQGGKIAGVFVGGGFLFIQTLSYLGYVEVDWLKFERDYQRLMDVDKDGKVTTKDFQAMFNDLTEVLKFNLPAGSGFSTGLGLGLTGSWKLALGVGGAYAGATSVALGGDLPSLLTSGDFTSVEGLKDFGNQMSSKILESARGLDPEVALETNLNGRSLEDLRQLEFEIKHDVGISAKLMDIDVEKFDRDVLLDQIESAKKHVKLVARMS